MSEGKFTPAAAVLWTTVPKEARARILETVFCVRCSGVATMVKYRGAEKGGDIILTGKCAQCGHKVVRVVETSEWDRSVN
jgi:hypothetical protein